MRTILLLAAAALSTLSSTPSFAKVIELTCGDDFNLTIDTDRKAVDVYQPGKESSYVDGRKLTLTGGGNQLYAQTVFISDDLVEFRNWVLPNGSFGAAAFGFCEDISISRASGILTYKSGCMLGGAVGFQRRCAPGHSGPLEKKF